MNAARGIPTSLARTIPRDVSAAARRVGHLEDLIEEARRLGIELPGSLEGAVAKRRREYLAGRISARLALRELLGSTASGGDVGADAEDVPLWPKEVIGSISHGAGTGFAAVAAASSYLGLGVDVERVVSVKQAVRLGPRVLTDRELELREGTFGGLTEAEMFTLAFSAKESAYKSLFPRHRRILGFSDVELESRHSPDGTDLHGHVTLRARLNADAPGEAVALEGCYAFTRGADDGSGDTRRVWTLVFAGFHWRG